MTQQPLKGRISEIADRLIRVEQPRPNRMTLLCESENSFEVNRFLFSELGLRFVIVTGIDAEDCFEILYHYSNDHTGCIATVKAFIRDREEPSIESITPLIPGAEWIEREVHDILGIDFVNHPNLKRLILHDDWPQGVYPLRKEVRT